MASSLNPAMLFFAGFAALGQLPIMILLFVGIYMVLFLPQQRKQKAWAAQLAAIKVGDKVTTTGGVRGTIVSMRDDLIVVRTAPDGVKLEFAKAAIAAVTTEEPAKS